MVNNNIPLSSQVDEAEVLVASTVGESVDNRRRVDVIKQQEILIREEEREKMERHRERLEKEMRVSCNLIIGCHDNML